MLVQKTPSSKHHLGAWSIITPGSHVTDTCNYIRTMWADSSTPRCFHCLFFFFPSSKLTPVTDWLDDLSIDLPDPSRALPTDTPDGRSFHRSLRRILSCISQDKQALMAKGKARRNRGVSPPPQNKHRNMAELSEQTYLILTSVSVEAMHAVCASLMLYALADTRGTIK